MVSFFIEASDFLNAHFYLFVLLGSIIFSMPVKKREHFSFRVCLGCLLCVLFCLLVEEPIYSALMAWTDQLFLRSLIGMFRSLLLYAISTAVILFCYQYSVKNAAYVGVFGYTLQHMTFLLYYCGYPFSSAKFKPLCRKVLAQSWVGTPCHQNTLLIPKGFVCVLMSAKPR